MIIYDNGGKTLDRYTVFPFHGSYEFIGMSEGGIAFSLWGELDKTFYHKTKGSHLGKRILKKDLSLATQKHIDYRLLEELS